MTIENLLSTATNQLRASGSTTPRLDCLILFETVLGKERLWIIAHPDHSLLPEQEKALHTLIAKRARHIPLAYLTGKQEFYGRQFSVTPDVLIPRPETEDLIAIAKNARPATLLDVGTGSGAIAITLALETGAATTACDTSLTALAVAKQNAKVLTAPVTFVHSNLLQNIHGQFDCIVANLPYVDKTWQRSPETAHEPAEALFASDHGLGLIKKLVLQAPSHLAAGGHLVLEADPRQHTAIAAFAKANNFTLSKSISFALEFYSKGS
ncbi:MAG TPA: peptide chain release factor N(5)-glutamine methyltransferase [Candidatus Saccharimonadales bacterium]|nr:peptide chain release factor N(5)-glutamine methyltransferase [Candidatus Saccharimonadales bacterium]